MKEKIYEIIYRKLPSYDGELDLKSDFSDDLAADSLDMLDIVSDVEKEYNITIHDDEIQVIKTVGDLVRLIQRKL